MGSRQKRNGFLRDITLKTDDKASQGIIAILRIGQGLSQQEMIDYLKELGARVVGMAAAHEEALEVTTSAWAAAYVQKLTQKP
jgi:two-component sensor histidine kinase